LWNKNGINNWVRILIDSPLYLHPVFKESGDKGEGYRMSKKGRKVPRGILYMLMLSAIQRNPIIKEIYEERTSKGMNKMQLPGSYIFI
jgi:Transposase IS116/IS110/IS902 family.